MEMSPDVKLRRRNGRLPTQVKNVELKEILITDTSQTTQKYTA